MTQYILLQRKESFKSDIITPQFSGNFPILFKYVCTLPPTTPLLPTLSLYFPLLFLCLLFRYVMLPLLTIQTLSRILQKHTKNKTVEKTFQILIKVYSYRKSYSDTERTRLPTCTSHGQCSPDVAIPGRRLGLRRTHEPNGDPPGCSRLEPRLDPIPFHVPLRTNTSL